MFRPTSRPCCRQLKTMAFLPLHSLALFSCAFLLPVPLSAVLLAVAPSISPTTATIATSGASQVQPISRDPATITALGLLAPLPSTLHQGSASPAQAVTETNLSALLTDSVAEGHSPEAPAPSCVFSAAHSVLCTALFSTLIRPYLRPSTDPKVLFEVLPRVVEQGGNRVSLNLRMFQDW